MRQVLWVCVFSVLALMPATPSHADDVIRIATFNIRIFGKTKMGRPDVVQTLADIVRKYDLVAVQEIKDASEQVAEDFLAELGMAGTWLKVRVLGGIRTTPHHVSNTSITSGQTQSLLWTTAFFSMTPMINSNVNHGWPASRCWTETSRLSHRYPHQA